VALAAPTALAAARLADTASRQAALLAADDQGRLGSLTATTLHRLLGWKPGAQMRFRHDRSNRLAHDVVVVDEASMVSVTMMARLVEALRPTTRLILVGDPSQLTSVEAGAVLGDLVSRPAPADAVVPRELEQLVSGFDGVDAAERRAATTTGVVELARGYRFSGAIEALADAVRRGDGAAAVEILRSGADGVSFVDGDAAGGRDLDALRADAVATGRHVAAEALAGRATAAVAALRRHRLLCAHREGPYGVARWSGQVEAWLREAIDGYGADGLWYVGRPLLVTANDYQADLLNGDTGVVVDVDGRPQAAIARDAGVRLMPTSRLSDIETLHAMSVHKSQGSQFDAVTLILPPPESPLLTRELFYTAITRAESQVRVIGPAASVEAAVGRRILRASGLRERA
jgi:exodeoxyribonuclease V alpha subunit